LTAGRQERSEKATWRTLPEKEPAKQLKRKARPPARMKNNCNFMQHFYTC
jgi:hypothetical protein